jgi:hypothetical protein
MTVRRQAVMNLAPILGLSSRIEDGPYCRPCNGLVSTTATAKRR